MAETHTPIYSRFMAYRYLFPVIVLLFLLLSAMAFYICYRHHTMITELSLKEDSSTANLLSLIIDERLKKIVSVMESYSNSPLLLQAVRNKNAEKAKVHLISLTKSNRDIDSVIITDRQGILWATYPKRPAVLGKSFAYRDWYKDISKEWKPNISDIILRVVAEKDLAVQISVPFINEKGDVIGILVNTQRTVALGNLIKQVPLDPDNFIAVTDRKGQIIYSSEHADNKEIKLYPFNAGMKKAMAEKNITFAAFDPDRGGGRRYISFAPVANIGWTVFVERNKRSIFMSETGYYFRVTAITCLLCLVIILLLVYSRSQVKAQQIVAQLQAEKKIQAAEDKFRVLTENIQVGIVAHAPDTSILLSNPMASEILGLTPDQMRGKKAIDPAWCFIHEDGSKVPLAEYPINRALADEMPISGLVLGVIRPDRQSPTWVECNARKIWGTVGKLEQAIVVFSDITDRMRSEIVLRESRDLLSYAFYKSPLMGTISALSTGKYLEVNESFCRVSKFSREEVIGKTAIELGWISKVERMRMIQEVQQAEWENSIELPLRSKNGQNIIARYWGTVIHTTQGDILFSTAEDITERKRSEEALRLKNLVFDMSIAANSIADVAGVITQANNTFLQLWGYSNKDEVVGRPLMDFVQNQGEAIAIITALNETGQWKGEYTAKKKDGSTFIAYGLATVIRDEKGNLIGYQSAVLDITERKKIEAALAKNYQWLTFINEYATALPLQPQERLRTYAADRLKELTNATAVMISEYDTKTSELVVVGSTLAPDPDSAIRRLLGRNIVGLRSPVSPEMYREIVKSPVGAMQSMHEVTFSAVPKLVGGAIEKFLGITGFIGLALTNDQQLMGTLMIVANNATRQPNPDVLSSFASITAITIERQRTEEKLLQHRAHLEAMVAERTAELSAKTTELERINKIFVDRELRMRELKARIAELEGKT